MLRFVLELGFGAVTFAATNKASPHLSQYPLPSSIINRQRGRSS